MTARRSGPGSPSTARWTALLPGADAELALLLGTRGSDGPSCGSTTPPRPRAAAAGRPARRYVPRRFGCRCGRWPRSWRPRPPRRSCRPPPGCSGLAVARVAAGLPRGATAVRGRVRAGAAGALGAAERRPPRDGPIGRGHADERGEFLLVIATPGRFRRRRRARSSSTWSSPRPTRRRRRTPRPVRRPGDRAAAPARQPAAARRARQRRAAGDRGPTRLRRQHRAVPTLSVTIGGELTLTDPIPFAA